MSILAHVRWARDQVMAVALPDEREYLAAQQAGASLITSEHTEPVFHVVLDDDDDDDRDRLLEAGRTDTMRAAVLSRQDHRLVSELKTTLDGPLDDRAVRRGWWQTWRLAPLLVGALMIFGMAVWLVASD